MTSFNNITIHHTFTAELFWGIQPVLQNPMLLIKHIPNTLETIYLNVHHTKVSHNVVRFTVSLTTTMLFNHKNQKLIKRQ